MEIVATALGWLLILLAAAGCLYTLIATGLVGRYRAPAFVAATPPAVTVLKPLHGAEPRLAANLETLLAQDHAGPLQIVFGVARPDDPAIAIVTALRTAHPDADIALVVNPTRHGANAKISNVINIMAEARHKLIVLADSDVAWPPDTLSRLAAALADPQTGLASCLHTGRGDAGFWSTLGAMDISYRFLPSIAVGIAAGLAAPTLGPTLALSRQTLDSIGGFQCVADALADDYELGRAVRALGLRTLVPPFTITHSGDERTAAALIGHELRWTRTIRGLDPRGFAGSLITHPVPLALIAVALTGPGLKNAALALLAATLATRILLKRRIDSVTASSAGPLWLLPIRDLLSAALFVAQFFVDTVTWRGTRYRVTRDGRILPEGAPK